MQAVIYAFRSPGSGAVYLGKHECDPTHWPRRGNGRLPDGYGGGGKAVPHFHRRHGRAVQWRILAVVPLSDSPRAERRAIRLARYLLGRKCVNILSGGDGFTSADARALNADAMVKARISTTSKERWADPEARAMICAAMVRPEVRAKVSAASKARWADPQYAEKMSATTKAHAATPTGAATLARAWAANRTHEARAKQKATRIRNWVRAANARNRARREAAMEAPR